METLQGYVVLQGQKIFISVRMVQEHRYITALTGAPIGRPARLAKIEEALRKVNGARSKLMSGKALPV